MQAGARPTFVLRPSFDAFFNQRVRHTFEVFSFFLAVFMFSLLVVLHVSFLGKPNCFEDVADEDIEKHQLLQIEVPGVWTRLAEEILAQVDSLDPSSPLRADLSSSLMRLAFGLSVTLPTSAYSLLDASLADAGHSTVLHPANADASDATSTPSPAHPSQPRSSASLDDARLPATSHAQPSSHPKADGLSAAAHAAPSSEMPSLLPTAAATASQPQPAHTLSGKAAGLASSEPVPESVHAGTPGRTEAVAGTERVETEAGTEAGSSAEAAGVQAADESGASRGEADSLSVEQLEELHFMARVLFGESSLPDTPAVQAAVEHSKQKEGQKDLFPRGNLRAKDRLKKVKRSGRSSHRDGFQSLFSDPLYHYSFEPAFVHLTPASRSHHNVSKLSLKLPSASACFGSRPMQLLLECFLGYDTVILNGLMSRFGARGYLYNLGTEEAFDFSVVRSIERDSLTAEGAFLFKLSVLVTAIIIFVLASLLVSVTVRESHVRILKFAVAIQHHVRFRLPVLPLILSHLAETLLFIPIMIGILVLMIELMEDKLLAVMFLTLIWICEATLFSCVRNRYVLVFFPRFFLLYQLLFLFYSLCFPFGFTYIAVLADYACVQHAFIMLCNRFVRVGGRRAVHSVANNNVAQPPPPERREPPQGRHSPSLPLPPDPAQPQT